MAKRQRSVSLSFVLLRFAVVMLGSMVLCCMAWLFVQWLLGSCGVIYQGYVPNQQVERMLAGEPKAFVSPGNDFLSEYALFDQNGKVLESSMEGKKLEELKSFLGQEAVYDVHIVRHTYEDGSTVIIRWYYRKEFVNPMLRRILPPFEYLWWGTLSVALCMCLLLHTLWLRRRLAAKLELFSEVSAKVGAQELDFTVPCAGIREYDQALGAMEQMRVALYDALSAQWAAQQEREAEIAALAHDLKTPLTLAGGNAELLLEEELPERSRKRLEVIKASNDLARQYVVSLLETSAGEEEFFESTSLSIMFDELCRNAKAVADARGVHLQVQNGLQGRAGIQKKHMLRALSNVVLNAVEHTQEGGSVFLEGIMAGSIEGSMAAGIESSMKSSMADGGWKIVVRDEGPGFSKAALHHATERLWRGDTARGADGHNGLGLWFAAQVVKAHSGQLELQNGSSGGVVTISIPQG